MGNSWRSGMGELADLVSPVSCVGCAIDGARLCRRCAQGVKPEARWVRTADGLDVASGLRLHSVAQAVVRAAKESGERQMVAPLAHATAGALRLALARQIGIGGVEVLLVPVPTRRQTFRRRGRHLVTDILRAAGVEPTHGLRWARQPDDQRGLGRDDRRQNLALALRATPRLAGRHAIIVDDVTTTGATVDDAARALRAAGCRVVCAVVVADTPVIFPSRPIFR